MANKEQFKVMEAKSTVQKLVDYNSNTLLPYTILDAITEYTESGKTAAFGIDLIFKKILSEIDKNDIAISSQGSVGRYYPVFYDANALNESNYTGGLVKGKTAFSYRDPQSSSDPGELKFLTQNGEFESAPLYQFITECVPGSNGTAKAFDSSVTSDYVQNTKTVNLTFSFDDKHFTSDYSNAQGRRHMFGPFGSFGNFLDAIDGVTYRDGEGTDQDQMTNSNTGLVRPASEYVSLFYKSQNGADIITSTLSKPISDLRVGYAFNLRSTTHDKYIAYHRDSNSSIKDGTINSGNSDSFIVIQEGEDITKFLKINTGDSNIFVSGNQNERNGNVCLVTDNTGVLKWDSAGINIVNVGDDNTEHYLLGKTTNNNDSSIRNDQLVYSEKAYFKNGSVFQSSDERLKTFKDCNITLKDITSIKVSKFVWNDNSDIMHFGVSAQSVEKILPEIVSTSSRGFKSVEYDKLGALSIYGIKLLTDEIDSLKQRIEKLEEKLK